MLFVSGRCTPSGPSDLTASLMGPLGGTDPGVAATESSTIRLAGNEFDHRPTRTESSERAAEPNDTVTPTGEKKDAGCGSS